MSSPQAKDGSHEGDSSEGKTDHKPLFTTNYSLMNIHYTRKK
jgi:hypothetical protein